MTQASDARRDITVSFVDGRATRHHLDSIVNLVMANSCCARFVAVERQSSAENRILVEARPLASLDSEMHSSIAM